MVTEQEPSVFVLNEDVAMATWQTAEFTEMSASFTRVIIIIIYLPL